MSENKKGYGLFFIGLVVGMALLTGIFFYVNHTDLRKEKLYYVPTWLKGVAGWYASGEIEEEEFYHVIQYLMEHGIIHER